MFESQVILKFPLPICIEWNGHTQSQEHAHQRKNEEMHKEILSIF